MFLVSTLLFLLAGMMQVGSAHADEITSAVPVGGTPDKIAINPNTDRIYVSQLRNDNVTVIDGSTNSIVGTISGLGNLLTVNPVANKIYSGVTWQDTSRWIASCCYYGGCDVKIFDIATNTMEATIPVSQGTTFCHTGIVANPKTNMIYQVLQKLVQRPDIGVDHYGYLAIVNATSNSFVGNMSLPAVPQAIVMNPETNKIYLSYWGDGCTCVTVIDANTNTISSTISLGSADGYSMAVDTAANKIYVAPGVTGSGILVIDGATDTLTGSIGLLSNPFYVAVDQSSNKIFSETGTMIASLDGANGNIWETYYDSKGAGPIGVNPTTNTAYFSDSAGDVTVLNENLDPMPILTTMGHVSYSPYQISIPNFHMGTGTNNLLLVGISANNNSAVSVTYGGTQLKQAVSSFNNNDAEFWYLANPGSTGGITVTMSGPTGAVVGAYSIPGVDQSSPIVSVTKAYALTSSSPSISINAKYAGDMIVDLPSIYGTPSLGSPTCTPQWMIDASSITGASSTANVASPGNMTCSWTASSGDLWDDVAIEVKASSSTSSSTSPGSPTGLAATTASSSQINLSWTAPVNDGGSIITGYMIERSSNGGSTWSMIVPSTGSTATTYSDSGLAHSTTYTYRVSAINDIGTSQPSNTSSATTFNVVPMPPTGLKATVQVLKIDLNWNTPSDNGGTQITGYMIERSVNNGNTWSTIVSNTGNTGTTYSDTNVLPLTTYTYRVSAINDIGTGNPSNTASASIASKPTLS